MLSKLNCLDSRVLVSDARQETKMILPPSGWWRNDSFKYKTVTYLKCQSGHEEFGSWCSLQLSQMLDQRSLKITGKMTRCEIKGPIFAIINTNQHRSNKINRSLTTNSFEISKAKTQTPYVVSTTPRGRLYAFQHLHAMFIELFCLGFFSLSLCIGLLATRHKKIIILQNK